MDKKVCIYCWKEKETNEFSLEHIWPQSLGGNLTDNSLRTDYVCKKCNSLCGVFVDGGFVKSWFVKAEVSQSGYNALNPNNYKNCIAPPTYLGKISGFEDITDDIIEFWAGACGAHNVVIRPKDDDESFFGYAGGNPKKNKQKNRRAYLSLTSSEPFWCFVAIESFIKTFEYHELYSTNFDVPEFRNDKIFEMSQSKNYLKDRKVIDRIKEITKSGQSIHGKIEVNLKPEPRFLAKMGLGMGYKVFGAEYLESETAKTLKTCIWEKDYKKIFEHGLKYATMFNLPENDSIRDIVHTNNAWTIFLTTVKNNTILFIITPSGKVQSVLISDQKDLAHKIEENGKGRIWVIAPYQGIAINDITLVDFAAHRCGVNIIHDLEVIENVGSNISNLPPC